MMNLSKMKHLKSIRLVFFCHPTRNFLMLEFCLFRACSVFNDLSKIQIKLLTVNLLLTLSNLTPEWTRIIKLLDWQVQNYFVTHWVHSRMCKPLWCCTFDLQWEVNLWPWLCWCVGLRHVIFFFTWERHRVVGQLAPQSLQQLHSELTVVVVLRPLVPETVMFCATHNTACQLWNTATVRIQTIVRLGPCNNLFV